MLQVARMKALLQQHCRPVAVFVTWCEETFERPDLFPLPIKNFLQCIASVSPVCSYFPESNVFSDLLQDIKSGLDITKFPDKLHRLQCSAPIIFGVISHFPERTPPVSALQLFAMLEEKVEKTFQRQPHFLEPANEEEQGTEFSFLPKWPRKTQRGIYFQDLQGSKKHDSVTCNKDYRGHPTLMPGIFTLYCKHGMVYFCHFTFAFMFSSQ
eukprot:gene6452-7184_t